MVTDAIVGTIYEDSFCGLYNTMARLTLGIFLIGTVSLPPAVTVTDPKKCITRRETSLPVFEKEHCPITSNDVKLTCSSDKLVILSSMKLAVKDNDKKCLKRILTKNDDFCCNSAANDQLYDGQCLQGVWNKEDRAHYWDFINTALEKCMNTSRCVVNSKMFENLQTEIPVSKKHSSYLQVVYQCIQAPRRLTDLCSSRSVTGKDVHMRKSLTSWTNKTCSCQVNSQTGGDVIVRAVDVRPASGRLILSSKAKSKDVFREGVPVFGFREIYRDQTVNISMTMESPFEGNVWLYVSATNGKSVNVKCGETQPEIQSTPTFPGHVATEDHQYVFMGYWPLIYVASGSIFTMILVTCILSGILICRHRKKSKRRDDCCGHSPLPFRGDFQLYPNCHQYATVTDDTREHIPAPSHSHNHSHNYDKSYIRTYPRSAVITDRHLQTSLNTNRLEERARGTVSQGGSCNVSQLEAFLNCQEQDQ